MTSVQKLNGPEAERLFNEFMNAQGAYIGYVGSKYPTYVRKVRDPNKFVAAAEAVARDARAASLFCAVKAACDQAAAYCRDVGAPRTLEEARAFGFIQRMVELLNENE